MRFRLMTATALAPLWVVGLHGLAWAATDTVSSAVSTPLQTATAVNGGPGDIDVASGGAVNPSGGTAITLNSNNAVTVEGSIGITGANNAVGIQAASGVTGSITTTGAITVNETFSAAVNNDGFTQEPYAQGSGRYGVQTLGSFTGPVAVNGSVTIQGNNSYGVAIGNGLSGASGNLNVGTEGGTVGTVTVTGDNDVGVYTSGAIAGHAQIASSITMRGAGSNAVQITGSVGGPLTVYSSITATAYTTTTRPTTQALLNLVQAQPGQIEQGGSALIVSGGVGGGIFLGAPPSGTTASSTADLDGDGVADGVESTSVLSVYGSAPAMVIGGNSSPINIGQFGSCNSAGYSLGDNCFGLIVEGTISASGVFDNVNATALDIGAGNGGVNLSGGMRVAVGATISANSYASATAIRLESGAHLPLLQNEGTITADITSSTATSATAVLIQPGATLTSLTNFGTIHAGVTGDSASAYAIVDQSGSLSKVVNQYTIAADVTPTNVGEATTGGAVALDMRANTTGATYIQQEASQTSLTPSTVGDILMSSTAANDVELHAGTVNGALNLGSGAGSTLIIDGGASYVGNLTYTGSGLSINVAAGTLSNKLPSVISGPSLTVGSTSTLSFALDPRRAAGLSTNTEYNVGTANIAGGATIGVTFVSAPATTQTFTVVQAGSLTAGVTSLSASAPFLFNTTAQTNPAAGTLTVTVSPKSAAQLGLNKAEAAALPAIYASLGQDSGVLNALANASTSDTFHQAYQQMLPDSAGDVFQVVSSMSKSVTRAAVGSAAFDQTGPRHLSADDADNEEDDIGAPGGLWASEYIIGMNQERQNNEAYRAAGLGLVGGVDFGGFGADLSFASANVAKPHDPGDSIVSINHLQLGLYATQQFGLLHTEASFSGGYMRISERREFAATVVAGDESTTTPVSRTANAAWSGYDFSGHLGASAPFDVTEHLFLMPEAHLDYFDVSEGAYRETGGGPGFDINVDSRNSTQGSVTAGLVAGAHIGSSFVFKPQLELGWDDVVTGGPAATSARFAYGGPKFVLPANSVSGGAAMARLRLQGDGAFVHFDLEAGGEFRSDYQNADLRAVFRISY